MSKEAGRAVLVVEDDVSVRRPLVKFLEMHGFAVATAETVPHLLEPPWQMACSRPSRRRT
jgi:DNA-binding response OmpR family regulator